METSPAKPTLKQRIAHETAEYLVVLAYMATILAAFTAYRRLVLAEYGVVYYVYAFGLVEAMILAKIVLIGRALHVGERLHARARAWQVAYRSVAFGLLVFLFSGVEEAAKRLLHHGGILPDVRDMPSWAWDEALARSILLLVAFVPMFAMDELATYMGPGKLSAFFFRRREATPPGGAPPA